MFPTACDREEVVGPAARLLADVVDEKIDAAALAADPGQRLTADRLARGKMIASTLVHPFAPARLRMIQLAVKQIVI